MKVCPEMREDVVYLLSYLYPHNSAIEISRIINTKYENTQVSVSTIRRIIADGGYTYRKRTEVKRFTNGPVQIEQR